MSERENNVYKAKLAEQAERYDGKWKKLIFFNGRHCTALIKKFSIQFNVCKTCQNPGKVHTKC